MPIHDQSYRHYDGQHEPRGGGWWVIASAGIRRMFSKRLFVAFLLLGWAQFFYRAVVMYVVTIYPQLSMLATTADTFHNFLERQGFFVFFIVIWAGAGLIANDRRANALQIYLAKPLTRAEYVAGKFLILATFLLMVTWLPAVLLLILQMLFAGNFTFIRTNIYLFPAITVYSILQVLLFSFVMLALSSLSKSSRYVAVLYAGVYFFTEAIYLVMWAITRNSHFSWLSYGASLRQVGNVIFRLPPQYETPWGASLLVVLGLIGVSIWVLERRVRGVEVVT